MKWALILVSLSIAVLSFAGCSQQKSSESAKSPNTIESIDGKHQKNEGIEKTQNANEVISKNPKQETAMKENNQASKVGNSENNEMSGNTPGNTFGNILSGGYYASEGDWIYYCDVQDGKKLYKMKLDGSEKTKLCDDGVSSINVLNGWVYYVANNKICKIKNSGTGKSIVIANEISGRMHVVGNWIYFSFYTPYDSAMRKESTLEDAKIPGLKVYRVKIDGTGMQKLCNFSDFDGWGSAEFLGVNADRIFIRGTKGHLAAADFTTYFDLKASKFVEVSNAPCSFDLEGSLLYIAQQEHVGLAGSSGTNKIVKKNSTDSSEMVLLPGVKAFSIKAKDGWIYYSTDTGIFKAKNDGTKNVKISDTGINANISIVGNCMFYLDEENKGGKLKID